MDMICPDFRELFDRSSFSASINIVKEKHYGFNRIFIGSSFCPIFFLNTNIYSEAIKYCSLNHIKISLAVPVFNEALLEQGKIKIKELIESGKNEIDELIVNDIGMLRYAMEELAIPIVLGRLFFKDPRDGRLSAFIERTAEISLLSSTDLLNRKKIAGIEIDPVSDILDLNTISGYSGTVTLNGPYCYMSTGMICKYGSVNKSINRKFRPSAICGLECRHMVEVHSDHYRPAEKKLIRAGRAVYFYQPKVRTIGHEVDRYLYFPLDEFIQYLAR